MKGFFGRFSTRAKVIWGVLLVVVLLVVFVVVRGRSRANTAFETTPVTRGGLTATVGATGTVRAIQSAMLNWQINGVVGDVKVKVGDRVAKGDVLASLDPSQLPQNVILAKSDLVAAQKALQDASSATASAQAAIDLKSAQDAYKKAYDYRQSLNGKQWVEEVKITYVNGQQVPVIKWVKTEPDAATIQDADNKLALAKAKLDDAQRTYDRLKQGPNPADIAAAQARVDAAQATVNSATIIAPFSGTVTQAEPLPGDQVAAASPAFRVDDLSNLLVDVQVSEVDVNNVAPDQPATLTLDAIPGKTYHGQVTEVSQAGDQSSGAVNFTATVQLTDPDAAVKPGMTAAVNVITQQVKDQLVIPNRAVRLVDGQRVVYVLKNGQPQPVKVTLGVSSDTQSVVTAGDLKVGDLLVLNPPAQIRGGPFGGGGG
ncbi:MAG TPA: efflux RND transporter periplasmic adaptor subunit [Anaerolineales bacterium]|nr:efflux RND transporter periplasmic adaptor subunit [Anaerolineales bacterium]